MILLKSPTEVDKIRTSCRIVRRTLDFLKSKIKPGIKTKELNIAGEEFIYSQKARPSFKGYMGYPAGICVSVNEELVHGIGSERKLKETDVVSLDVGVELDGFFGDAARTFAVSGKVSGEAKRLIEITRLSLERGIEQAVCGKRLFDISAAIQRCVEEAGFSVVRRFVGHGVGLRVHEDPQIPNYGKPHTGIKLKAGMVLAIEPMVNAGSWEVDILDDGWTAVTKDRRLCAHFGL